MNNKIKYFAANIIAPGLGHFAMKKWGRGLIYFLGSSVCVAWLIIAFVKNIIGLYYMTMDTDDSVFDPVRLLISIFTPIGVLIILWGFSYVDICFFCKLKTVKEEEKVNDQ